VLVLVFIMGGEAGARNRLLCIGWRGDSNNGESGTSTYTSLRPRLFSFRIPGYYPFISPFSLFLPYPTVGTLPRLRLFQRSSCYCYSVTTPSLMTSSEHPMWYYTTQGTILSRKKSIRGDFHSVCYYCV
jgi:hypothetical protein